MAASRDVEDIHICGMCKAEFTDIFEFLKHKKTHTQTKSTLRKALPTITHTTTSDQASSERISQNFESVPARQNGDICSLINNSRNPWSKLDCCSSTIEQSHSGLDSKSLEASVAIENVRSRNEILTAAKPGTQQHGKLSSEGIAVYVVSPKSFESSVFTTKPDVNTPKSMPASESLETSNVKGACSELDSCNGFKSTSSVTMGFISPRSTQEHSFTPKDPSCHFSESSPTAVSGSDNSTPCPEDLEVGRISDSVLGHEQQTLAMQELGNTSGRTLVTAVCDSNSSALDSTECSPFSNGSFFPEKTVQRTADFTNSKTVAQAGPTKVALLSYIRQNTASAPTIVEGSRAIHRHKVSMDKRERLQGLSEELLDASNSSESLNKMSQSKDEVHPRIGSLLPVASYANTSLKSFKAVFKSPSHSGHRLSPAADIDLAPSHMDSHQASTSAQLPINQGSSTDGKAVVYKNISATAKGKKSSWCSALVPPIQSGMNGDGSNQKKKTERQIDFNITVAPSFMQNLHTQNSSVNQLHVIGSKHLPPTNSLNLNFSSNKSYYGVPFSIDRGDSVTNMMQREPVSKVNLEPIIPIEKSVEPHLLTCSSSVGLPIGVSGTLSEKLCPSKASLHSKPAVFPQKNLSQDTQVTALPSSGIDPTRNSCNKGYVTYKNDDASAILVQRNALQHGHMLPASHTQSERLLSGNSQSGHKLQGNPSNTLWNVENSEQILVQVEAKDLPIPPQAQQFPEHTEQKQQQLHSVVTPACSMSMGQELHSNSHTSHPRDLPAVSWNVQHQLVAPQIQQNNDTKILVVTQPHKLEPGPSSAKKLKLAQTPTMSGDAAVVRHPLTTQVTPANVVTSGESSREPCIIRTKKNQSSKPNSLRQQPYFSSTIIKPIEPKGQVPPNQDGKQQRTFTCKFDKCRYTSTLYKDFQRHYRTHTGEKPYRCTKCEKSFNRSDKLRIHLRWHEGSKPFQCHLCDYKTLEGGSLKKHLRIHSDERPYKCQICPYASRNSSHLIVHLRSHTGDSPFICSVCGAKFKINSDLKRHIRTHTGEKPFQCQHCDYRSTCNGNLKTHIRINHSKANEVKCDHCDFSTSSQRRLKEHIKSHVMTNAAVAAAVPGANAAATASTSDSSGRGETVATAPLFRCQQCTFTCHNAKALRAHLCSHDTMKPYQCSFCPYASKQSGNLRKHVLSLHMDKLQAGQQGGHSQKKQTMAKRVLHPGKKSNKGHSKSMSRRPVSHYAKQHKCPECACEFVRQDSLRSHLNQHRRAASQNKVYPQGITSPFFNTATTSRTSSQAGSQPRANHNRPSIQLIAATAAKLFENFAGSKNHGAEVNNSSSAGQEGKGSEMNSSCVQQERVQSERRDRKSLVHSLTLLKNSGGTVGRLSSVDVSDQKSTLGAESIPATAQAQRQKNSSNMPLQGQCQASEAVALYPTLSASAVYESMQQPLEQAADKHQLNPPGAGNSVSGDIGRRRKLRASKPASNPSLTQIPGAQKSGVYPSYQGNSSNDVEQPRQQQQQQQQQQPHPSHEPVNVTHAQQVVLQSSQPTTAGAVQELLLTGAGENTLVFTQQGDDVGNFEPSVSFQPMASQTLVQHTATTQLPAQALAQPETHIQIVLPDAAVSGLTNNQNLCLPYQQVLLQVQNGQVEVVSLPYAQAPLNRRIQGPKIFQTSSSVAGDSNSNNSRCSGFQYQPALQFQQSESIRAVGDGGHGVTKTAGASVVDIPDLPSNEEPSQVVIVELEGPREGMQMVEGMRVFNSPWSMS